MRIGRGYPQQSFTVAGQALGPREPAVVGSAPVVTTLSINLASGLLTNQRRGQMRFPRQGWEPGVTQTTGAAAQTWGSLSRRLGPAPPERIGALPTQEQQQLAIHLRAVDRVQAGYVRRAPHSQLFGVIGPQAPPVVTTLSVNFDQAVQRARRALTPFLSLLAAPTVTASAAPIAPIQTSLVDNRIRGYGRRHFPSSVLYPPTVLQVFAASRGTLVRLRPRETAAALRAPTVIRVPSAEQREQTVAVALVHTRPRPTTKTLRPPTALQTFAGPVETEVAIRIPLEDRRRLTHAHLTPPTVVRIPSVEQLEQTIHVALVRTRPRPTSHTLSKPTVLQVFVTGKPALALTRPRKTSWKLAAPTVVRVPSVEQQEDSIRVALVRTRPRPTTKTLGKPTVLLVPSVEQKRVTLTAWLTKSRPRPTGKRLAPPTVVISNPPVVSTLSVTLDAVRRATEQRRHVVAHFLRAPTVVIPLPTLRMQTISVALTRIRPRATRRFLAKPTALQVFFGPQSILTKTRPRHTSALLAKPTALRTFVGPAISRTRTRPRPTVHFLRPPTLVRVPSVEQREDSITVSLARTRPRPTTHRLIGPTVLRSFVAAPLRVALTRVRARRTTQRLTLTSPTAPAVTTLLSRITRIRPPRTTVALSAGIILSRPSQLAQTIRTTLVTARPRATQKLLAQPVRVAPPPTLAQQTLRVAYENAVTTRTSLLRRPSSHLIHPPTAIRAQRDAEFELGELGDGWHAGMPSEGWQSGERAPDWKPGTPSTGWLSDTIGGSWRADKPQS